MAQVDFSDGNIQLKSTFGLNAFIDSCVWGYANDLLKNIDDMYCKTENGNYDYEKRNYSTSHVHMMLSTALTKIMDSTECVIFLNTPNSIDFNSVISKTNSPWIYYELAMTQMIRKNEPRRISEIVKKSIFESAQADKLNITYDVNTKSLKNINYDNIIQWEKLYKGRTSQDEYKHALDFLYDMQYTLKKDVGEIVYG